MQGGLFPAQFLEQFFLRTQHHSFDSVSFLGSAIFACGASPQVNTARDALQFGKADKRIYLSTPLPKSSKTLVRSREEVVLNSED
jgi:hypothetical protein